jgi:riboflavin transporter FmnP
MSKLAAFGLLGVVLVVMNAVVSKAITFHGDLMRARRDEFSQNDKFLCSINFVFWCIMGIVSVVVSYLYFIKLAEFIKMPRIGS